MAKALLVVGALLCTAALAVGVAACGSGTDSTTDATTTRAGGSPGGGGAGEKSQEAGPGAPPKARTSNPRPRHRFKGPPGSTMHRTYPGRIFGHGLAVGGPVQPAELWPVTNGWRISDHRRFTAVYAGADPQRHSTGRLVIFRQNFVHVTQTSRRVDVAGAGALEITAAPQGRGEQTSAQRDGNLRFRGRNGVTGTLHLKDDKVTIDS